MSLLTALEALLTPPKGPIRDAVYGFIAAETGGTVKDGKLCITISGLVAKAEPQLTTTGLIKSLVLSVAPNGVALGAAGVVSADDLAATLAALAAERKIGVEQLLDNAFPHGIVIKE